MKLEELTVNFRANYDKFFIACDTQEVMNSWDKNQNGEMEVYYENEILGIILQLVAADEKITDEEVAFINRAFGYEMDRNYVVEACSNVMEKSISDYVSEVRESIAYLDTLGNDLGTHYRDLIMCACDIVSQSDEVASAEQQLIDELRASL